MKKIKLLLVGNPKTDLGFGRVAKLPNLGLTSIASNIDEEICEVRVLDLVMFGNRSFKVLIDNINNFKPDVVGYSAMSFQFEEAISLAEKIKNLNSKIVTVLGGYHATVAPDHVLLHKKGRKVFDYLLRNEGEIVFSNFIKALYDGVGVKKVSNISFLEGDDIIHNPPGEMPDVNALKLPGRKKRIVKKGFYLFGNPADVIETSRGCTFNCDFCSIRQMYGKSYRKYSIERVIADLKDAKANGAKAIFVVDDNITIDGNRFKKLCEAIIEEKLNLKFFIQASINGLSRTAGLIELMKKAGVSWVFLGIENISEENLKYLDKNDQFKNDEVHKVVADLNKNGILTIGGLIMGNPDDNEKTIRENYEYALKLKLTVALFFILTPFPKTEIREKLAAENLITNEYDFSDYTCFKANVRTKYLSSEELYELREELGFKYPIQSGGIWRLAQEFFKHPLFFTWNLGINQLINDPLEVFSYLKGFLPKKN